MVCKQNRSGTLIPLSHSPPTVKTQQGSQSLTHNEGSSAFGKHVYQFLFFFFFVVLLSAQPAPFCSQLHSAPSPHFPPISLVNVGHSSHMSHSLNSTEFVSTTKSRESVCRGRKRGRKKEKKACECQWKERQRQDWKP